jgi:Ca2+:H+ antiporter
VAGLTRRELLTLAAIAVLAAIAGVLNYAGGGGAIVTFAIVTAALAGLAWVVSFATEQVGEQFGPAVTGLMQTTLGNLPEFFIVIFALKAGETVVATTSIIGSLFANALLVLGLVIVTGSLKAKDNVMRFGARLPNDTATLLLLAVFIIVLTGLSVSSSDKASTHVKTISSVGAIAILVVYAVWVSAYIRSDQRPAGEGHGPRVKFAVSATMLAVAGVGAAFVSDWFIKALSPAVDQIGISKAFAGLVVVAIAGNAVENVVGIVLAYKGDSELAVSVVKNSVSQIAAFLFPALILVSLLFTTPLTFALAPVYIGALFVTAIVIWQVTGDGEATLFEGAALIALYVMLATFALYE